MNNKQFRKLSKILKEKKTINIPSLQCPVTLERLLPGVEKISSQEVMTEYRFREMYEVYGNKVKEELKRRSLEAILELLIKDEKGLFDFNIVTDDCTQKRYIIGNLYVQKINKN